MTSERRSSSEDFGEGERIKLVVGEIYESFSPSQIAGGPRRREIIFPYQHAEEMGRRLDVAEFSRFYRLFELWDTREGFRLSTDRAFFVDIEIVDPEESPKWSVKIWGTCWQFSYSNGNPQIEYQPSPNVFWREEGSERLSREIATYPTEKRAELLTGSLAFIRWVISLDEELKATKAQVQPKTETPVSEGESEGKGPEVEEEWVSLRAVIKALSGLPLTEEQKTGLVRFLKEEAKRQEIRDLVDELFEEREICDAELQAWRKGVGGWQ